MRMNQLCLLLQLCVALFAVSARAEDTDLEKDDSIWGEDEAQPSTKQASPENETSIESASPVPSSQNTQAATGPTAAEYQALLERVDMMEGDIEQLLGEQDKLKTEQKRDRLNWSGSYRFNFNCFHLTDHTLDPYVEYLVVQLDENGAPIMEGGHPATVPHLNDTPVDRDEWLTPSWTHRLKLAMTYDFGETLRFYSQLGVYKYFNETLNTIGSIDHGSNAYPRDNAFRLERVYFDWFVAKRLTFSVGRIASPDGPPTELKENTERRSGWGVQMVNATIDTVMATVMVAPKTYFRFFYSPFGLHTNYSLISDISLIEDQGIDLLHAWGALFEVGIPKMNDSILQLGFLHIPKFTPRDVRIQFPGSDAPVSPDEIHGDTLGMYMGANALLLLKNIGHIGLDLFAAYGLTMLKPSDGRMVFNVPMEFEIHHPDTDEVLTVQEIPISYEIGLASFEEGSGSTNFGHTVYTGFRYTLPTSERYPTRLGGEYNWGTKYHEAWSHPGDQLLNKIGNKGMTFEAYLIQQLVPEHLFARVGYMELRRSYQGQMVGPTIAVDQRVRDVYFLVDLSW